ncbi:TIGR00730 family Rossman fold protein [Candidatus Dependentiae bacterium]|nr:TIGR00730 family Rossman fold protein [Candidatus Dependentiae bacterium]
MPSCFKDGLFLWMSCFRSSIQLVHGVCLLSKIRVPIVTVFGGSRVEQNNIYAQQAYELGKKLVESNMAVLTGGGPGIMLAANCGAMHMGNIKEKKSLWSVGIGLKGVDEHFHNPCARFIRVDSFATRKYLLMYHSIGFIALPGGIGTADEVFDVFDRLKHEKIQRKPIIFVGKKYWQPLFDWLENTMVAQHYATETSKHFFVLTDSIDEAVALMKQRLPLKLFASN